MWRSIFIWVVGYSRYLIGRIYLFSRSFFRRYPVRFILSRGGSVIVWLLVLGAILFLLFFIYIQYTLPDPESIAERRVGQSTKIYDETGQTLLYDIHGEEKRTVVPWENIPDSIRNAVLATEDSDFYRHRGIDITGILRAILKNLRNAEISQGASTITQQLVGNALVGRQVTLSRKIQEAILAIEVERRFTKDEIFWMYLNQVPFGSNAYGVEAASQTYFGKSIKDISLNESAALAALLQAPTYYSPFGSNIDKLLNRKDYVLGRMRDLGMITENEYLDSKASKITFKRGEVGITAPHFVIMVKEYLVSKYGEEAVENGGLRVITTLDTELQKIGEETVSKYSTINKGRYKANNAALVAIDPRNGKVRSLVGSADYFDVENEGNFNVATAKRQPGSSFKPFAYATLFKKGVSDSTILFDVQTEFNPYCSWTADQTKDRYGQDCYNPRNYDGQFRGPVSLRTALAQSLNIPAVKTLYLAGIPDTIETAESMGITTLTDRNRYGLSLVLGGAEVKLIDMVSAYGVFANEGVRNPWVIIDRIESGNGQIIESFQSHSDRVLDRQVSRMVTSILSDNNARAPVFGFNNSLYIPGIDVAAKTGTTQDNKDAWVVGYTTSLVAGAWTGNNDNKPMTAAGAGISATGPLWHEFMVRASQTTSPGYFSQPDPVSNEKPMMNGSYIGFDGSLHSILHYLDRSNPTGPAPSEPSNDPQYQNWELAVSRFR